MYVPLYRAVNVWAMRERLDMPMGIAALPQFYAARVEDDLAGQEGRPDRQ